MARAGLNPSVVTEVAGDLVDRHGAEALTLALVAKEVGVATPSLYKHVGGLDDLRSRVSAAATIQLSKALAEATVGLAGRDALVALASTYRSYAAEHPGLYPLTQVAPTSDDHRRAASETVAVVAAAPQRRRDRSGASYRRHPHGEGGTARLRRPRVPRGFGLPEDPTSSFDLLVDALDEALGRLGRRSGQ